MFAVVGGLEPWVAIACMAVVFIGAMVQSSIGIGLGLIASPILGLADPAFVPVALLVAILPMTITMAVRERHAIDRTGIGWAVAGRIPGTIAGAWLAARASHTVLAYVIAIVVLLAVLASASGLHFTPTTRNLAISGAASGFGGTVAGIGGPPMALTYQHSDPETMRATLAVFFIVGIAISFTTLAIAGVVGRRELELGALLMPASLLGAW
ncbi:MAG TPA: sulfite exporter TauE/SafE family protein, partial [Ilumatobacter sp.]|nr:sulfite exporter TauE/SafE family protein [Ilumatobacter sp.]